jgi:hypothetical protein
MSQPISRRARISLTIGMGTFGLIAIVVAVVLGGPSAVRRLVTNSESVSAIDTHEAQRAVRFGPRRVGGGSTVGQTIGGFANAADVLGLDDATFQRELDAMQATGATWLRFDFLWPTIEPQNGQFNWQLYDRVVPEATARGFRILGELSYTPPWARPANCTTTDKCPPANPADYQGFVQAVVARYKATVSDWEIWNEPNLSSFWATGPDPAAYTQLLKAAYPAIKAVDPNATVVTGGLAPSGVQDATRIPPLDYFKGMYAAGAQGSFDAFGMHPYTYPYTPDDPAPYNNYYNLGMYYDVMVANGDGNKQVWSTEAGAPTGTYVGTERRAISEAQQALTAQRIYEIAAQRPWQGPVLWFCFRDYGPDPTDIEQNFGILHNDWTPKPAYSAYVTAMQLPA